MRAGKPQNPKRKRKVRPQHGRPTRQEERWPRAGNLGTSPRERWKTPGPKAKTDHLAKVRARANQPHQKAGGITPKAAVGDLNHNNNGHHRAPRWIPVGLIGKGRPKEIRRDEAHGAKAGAKAGRFGRGKVEAVGPQQRVVWVEHRGGLLACRSSSLGVVGVSPLGFADRTLLWPEKTDLQLLLI